MFKKLSKVYDQGTDAGGGAAAAAPVTSSQSPASDNFNPFRDEPASAPAAEPPKTPPTQQTPPTAQQPVAPAQPNFANQSPADFARLAAEAAVNVMSARQAPPQQPVPLDQLPPDQFNKKFNVFQADANTFQSIFGFAPENPAQVQALNQTLQSLSLQSVTVARHIFEEKLREITGQLEPLVATVKAQESRRLEEAFYAANPDLKGFESLIGELQTAYVARGVRFNTTQELFSSVANHARKILQRTPVAGGSAPSAPNTQPAQPAMTPTSVGGRSSAGPATPPKNTAQRIFG